MSGSPRRRVPGFAVAFLAIAAFLAGCGRSGGDPSPGPTPTDRARPEGARTAGQTSSISAIEGEDMRQAGSQRIEEFLNGRVPGLQVLRDEAGKYQLRIRGASSLGNSDEEPLLIIDGMPVAQGGNSEALRVLDTRDVARVEVLKDASQTAMYGSRGANGVLIIRTRRN